MKNEKYGRKLGVFVYSHNFKKLKGVFSYDFNGSISNSSRFGDDSLFEFIFNGELLVLGGVFGVDGDDA